MREPLGHRLKYQRLALGISQQDIAKRVGISASYLNLIENSKRQVGGTLLLRLADALRLSLDDLSGERERQSVHAVQDVLNDPALQGIDTSQIDVHDLIVRFPAIAATLIRLQRTSVSALAEIETMATRLQDDPVLGQMLHQLLNQVTGLRGGAEIITEVADLSDQDRHRFSASILRDAQGLSHSLQALARYFDQASIKRRSVSPVREVEDAIIAANNHFPVLEDLADQLRRQIGERLDEASLTGYLSAHHGISVVRADGAAPAGVLHLRSSDPMATRLFHLCQTIALHEGEAILSELITNQALSSPQAEAGARRALASYVAGAMMMPYSAYRQAAEDHGYDVDLLSHLFGCSFEQAAHRLVTLRRPAAEGVPFGFLRADGVGRLVKRFPLPGLSMPSGGYGCALWPIYQTSATRGVVRQVVEFPNGAKFLMIAKSITKRVARWSELPLSFSVLLVCDIHYASRTVYGSGLALEDSTSHVPVGPACNLCPRFDCGHRQEDTVQINAQA